MVRLAVSWYILCLASTLMCCGFHKCMLGRMFGEACFVLVQVCTYLASTCGVIGVNRTSYECMVTPLQLVGHKPQVFAAQTCVCKVVGCQVNT